MPAPSTIQRTDPWRPALLSGVLGVAVPVLICVLAVAGASGRLGLEALRGGARAWLVAVGASIEVDGAVVDVLPIGATALAALMAGGVAVLVARDGVDDAVAFGAISGGVAGALAAVVSAATSTTAVGTSFVRAAFGAFVVVGLGTGVALAARYPSARRVPSRLAPFLPAAGWGARAAALVVAVAFVLVMVLAASRVRAAADLWAALDPGYGGGVLLAALCVLVIPTLVAWAVAVLLGPGIALGTDTHVNVTGVDVGALPAFPPLAVLPDPGPFLDLAVVLMAVPVAVAVWAGWRLTEQRAAQGVLDDVLHGTLAGALAGIVLALFALSGHGAIGPGLLARSGPPVLTTLLVGVGTMAVGGALGALGAHYRGARADRP